METSPELSSLRVTWADPYALTFRTDEGPLANKEVRRALMIGTDLQFIRDAVMPGSEAGWIPIAPGAAGHVPLEELPPSTRLLFDYNPTLAKQMLVDAGYGEGFKIEIGVNTAPVRATHFPPTAEMLASFWEELDVELEITLIDDVVYWSLLNARTHPDAVLTTMNGATTLPFSVLATNYLPGADDDLTPNLAFYDNPYFTDLYNEAAATVDPVEQTAMLEELFIIALDDVPYLPIANTFFLSMWWPWIQNYWGEIESFGRITPPWHLMWIDQDLKAEMEY